MPPEDPTVKAVRSLVETMFTSQGLTELKDMQEGLIKNFFMIIENFKNAARTAIDDKTTLENQITEAKEIMEDMKASLGNLGQAELDSIHKFRIWKELVNGPSR